MTTFYSNDNYEVNLLPEPVPVDNNGVTLYFNYEITNTLTDRSEGFPQFLPAAMEQADVLNEGLSKILNKVEPETTDNVVGLVQ